VERTKADQDQGDQEGDGKDLEQLWVVEVSFDQADCERQASKPDGKQSKGHSEELMMDELVTLINFEYESVVYCVAAEDHNCKTRARHYPHYHVKENVDV
jgi:hypothetical protein